MRANSVETIVILAATEGLRMRPLTRYIPKVLLPIGDKPIIIHHLERAEGVGIKRAIITLDKRIGETIQFSIEKGYRGKLDIEFIYQEVRGGLGYAILLCRKLLWGQNFLLCLGDEYNESDNIFRAVKKETYKGFDALLSLFQCSDPKKICSAASVTVDERTQRVFGFIEKPKLEEISGKYVFAGLAIFDTNLLDILEEADSSTFVQNEFSVGASFQLMIERGFIIGFVEETGRHVNLTKIEDFWEYNFTIFESLVWT